LTLRPSALVAGLVALLFAHFDGKTRATLFSFRSYAAVNFSPSLDLAVPMAPRRRPMLANTSIREARALAMHLSPRCVALASQPINNGTIQNALRTELSGVGFVMAIYAKCQGILLSALGALSVPALNRAGTGGVSA